MSQPTERQPAQMPDQPGAYGDPTGAYAVEQPKGVVPVAVVDQTPRRKHTGRKWAMGGLALLIAACCAGGIAVGANKLSDRGNSGTSQGPDSPSPAPSQSAGQKEGEDTVPATVGVEFPTYTNGAEVREARGGGEAELWKEITYDITKEVTTINTENGEKDSKDRTVHLSEWIYTGSMEDLRGTPAYIPQTQEEAADMLNGKNSNGNVRPQDVILFKVYNKGADGYSDWMDKWLDAGFKPGENGTVVGWQLHEHGKDDKIKQYKVYLPQGWITEYYYDNYTLTVDTDNFAATIYNPTDADGAMKITMSGGSFWGWGSAPKVEGEQSNFTNNAQGATYVYEGKQRQNVTLGVGTNINNGFKPSLIYEIDQKTGLPTRTGVNILFFNPKTGAIEAQVIDLPDQKYTP